MPYLDLAGFRAFSVMPGADVDSLEATEPGYILAQIEIASADVDSRLRKRYAVPFTATPYPLKAREWVAKLVTLQCYLKRGVNTLDQQIDEIKEAARVAKEEMREAADSEDGLYDLPLIASQQASGISKRGPLGYSEQGPYDWTRRQIEAIRNG